MTGGSRKERSKARKEASGKKSEDPGASQMAIRDTRYKEVKVDTKNHKPKKQYPVTLAYEDEHIDAVCVDQFTAVG